MCKRLPFPGIVIISRIFHLITQLIGLSSYATGVTGSHLANLAPPSDGARGNMMGICITCSMDVTFPNSSFMYCVNVVEAASIEAVTTQLSPQILLGFVF